MNIFKEMVRALYSVESYARFVRNKPGKVFLFGFLVQLFLIGFSVLFFLVQGGVRGAIDAIPDFELKNGNLYVEQPFTYDDGKVCVDIDTEGESRADREPFQLKEEYKEYQSVILIDKSSMTVKSGGSFVSGDRWETVDFDDLGSLSVSKNELYRYIPLMYAMLALVHVLALVFGTMGYFLWALLISLFGLLVASLANVRLRFGTVYIISVYSMVWTLVTGILNQLITTFFGFHLPVMWLIHAVITLVITWFVASMFAKNPELLPPVKAPRGYRPPAPGYDNRTGQLQHPIGQPNQQGRTGQWQHPMNQNQQGQSGQPGQWQHPMGQPNQPNQPGQPNQPNQPGQPNQPNQPNQPGQPNQPNQFAQQSRPSVSAPLETGAQADRIPNSAGDFVHSGSGNLTPSDGWSFGRSKQDAEGLQNDGARKNFEISEPPASPDGPDHSENAGDFR